MNNSQISIDPDRIRKLSLELRLLSNSLHEELFLIDQAISKLGNSWKDNEYEAFKKSIRGLMSRIKVVSDEISSRENELKLDSEILADYLRTQLH